jgi:hypothetical protein
MMIFFITAEVVFSYEIMCWFLELRVPLDMREFICVFLFLFSLVD